MGVRWIKAYFSFIVFFLAERSSENKTSVEAFVIILMDSHHTHTKHKYILIGASKPHCHPPPPRRWLRKKLFALSSFFLMRLISRYTIL